MDILSGHLCMQMEVYFESFFSRFCIANHYICLDDLGFCQVVLNQLIILFFPIQSFLSTGGREKGKI